jgi:hypothetical protein
MIRLVSVIVQVSNKPGSDTTRNSGILFAMPSLPHANDFLAHSFTLVNIACSLVHRDLSILDLLLPLLSPTLYNGAVLVSAAGPNVVSDR